MASAAPQPRKGILKKPARSEAEGVPAVHSRRQRTEEDNAEIARKHAAILQQRRELETAIFLDIERLTEFPLLRTPPYNAAHPAPDDAAAFLRLVRVFQPGDYDDLIEERNTCGLCGYALCAKPRKTFGPGGTWKLVHSGRHDFGIVRKEELEKWCSAACARRALYIKVQLNETAAWERVGIPDIQVELFPEEDEKSKGKGKQNEAAAAAAPTAEAQLAQELARLKLHEERRLAKDRETLALERGDAVAASSSADPDLAAARSAVQPTAKLMDINIMEKPVTTVPTKPTLAGKAADDAHLLLEGHKIRFQQ